MTDFLLTLLLGAMFGALIVLAWHYWQETCRHLDADAAAAAGPTGCCGAVQAGIRCTGCGHRQPVDGVPPRQTRELALRRPWVAVTELYGRWRARRVLLSDLIEPPAPGREAALSPPSAPAPVPGLQPAEAAYITEALRRPLPSTARKNGQVLADRLRRRIPYADDLTLARAVLAVHSDAVMIDAHQMTPSPIRVLISALAAAADDMTALERVGR